MCGITGYYLKENNISKETFDACIDSIAHRGPDARGAFIDNQHNVGLGHRRLSIIDLSSDADQPMTSRCGRYVIVYNGETYNYKEIIQDLNLNLRTSSDTEAILEAFVKCGPSFVNYLNGMYAIAIYDKAEKVLFLFRDRLGIKPLYYSQNNGDFLFASELKALKQFGRKLTINNSAINNYLYLGYVPQDQTIYKNVHKLAAGSYAIVKKDKIEIKQYWRIEDHISNHTIDNEKLAKKELKDLLSSSVEYRMLSDVPLGTFLSGGTDSSLITSVASKVSTNKIDTFSIGFKERKYNESHYAKKIAKHLGTNHHEFIVSDSDAQEVLEKAISNYDQPFADASAIPTYLVSRLTKNIATVALSGDGGDELFLGYGFYNWAKRLSNPMIWNSRKYIASLLDLTPSLRNKRAAMVFKCRNQERFKSHIFSQEQYFFSEEELPSILNKDYHIGVNLYEDNFFLEDNARILSATEQQSLFDIKNYLKDNLLVKVDMASMLTSLEVRVPLLDHRIVEKALNISSRLKVHHGVQKHLLKELLYDYVPKEIADHPKWGFGIPLDTWLKQDLKYLIDKYLAKDIVEKHGIINYSTLNKLKTDFIKGTNYFYNRIWSLIVLHKWLEEQSV